MPRCGRCDCLFKQEYLGLRYSECEPCRDLLQAVKEERAACILLVEDFYSKVPRGTKRALVETILIRDILAALRGRNS